MRLDFLWWVSATAQFRQEVAAAIAQGVQNYDAAVNFRAGSGQTFAAARKTLPLPPDVNVKLPPKDVKTELPPATD